MGQSNYIFSNDNNNQKKKFPSLSMQCTVCDSTVKNFVCSSCLIDATRNKIESILKLQKKRDELKKKVEEQIIAPEKDLKSRERNIRNQKQRNNTLREYVKQIQQENTVQEQITTKKFEEHIARTKLFSASRSELVEIMKANKIRPSNEIEDQDSFIKNRRQHCTNLLQYFPIFTNKGRITTKIFERSTCILCAPNSNVLYFLHREFHLPMGVVNEGFDFIEAILKHDNPEYIQSQNKLNPLSSFKEYWPSQNALYGMLGYIVLIVQQLSNILEIPLPYKMEYKGSKSIIMDIIGSEMKKKKIETSDSSMIDSPFESPYHYVPEPRYKKYALYENDSTFNPEPIHVTPFSLSDISSASSGKSLPNLPSGKEDGTLLSSLSSREQFAESVQLLNDNIVAICHAQGIMVSKHNSNNLFHNLLTLYHYENIGRLGPFSFYGYSKHRNTSSNATVTHFKSNILENYYYDQAMDIMRKIIVNPPEDLCLPQRPTAFKDMFANIIQENYLHDDDDA